MSGLINSIRLKWRASWSKCANISNVSSACDTCIQPCGKHVLVSSDILSKVDNCKSLSGTVKPYDQHMILLIPSSVYPIQQWPAKINPKSGAFTGADLDKKEANMKDDPWSYLSIFLARIQSLLDKRKAKILFTIGSVEDSDDMQPEDMDQFPPFDLLLFTPSYHHVSKVTLDHAVTSVVIYSPEMSSYILLAIGMVE